MARGLEGIGNRLQRVGAALQEFQTPGAFANFQLGEQQREQQAQLEQLGLGSPAARAARLMQVLSGQSGRQLQPGEQGPVAPALTPQEQLAQLGQLTALNVPGAQQALASNLQGQISPEEERAFRLQERGLALQERQFNQSVKKFEQSLKQGAQQDPQKVFDNQQKLRKEFTGLSGEFIKQRDAFARIQASAEDPSPAGDLALVFNYMKLLDPGSVVREGEFANAQNAAGIPARIRAQYNKALTGKLLANETRNDFVSRSKKLYDKAQRSQAKRETQYTTLATKSGLNPSQVVLDLNLDQVDFRTPPISPSVENAPFVDDVGVKQLSDEDILRALQ